MTAAVAGCTRDGTVLNFSGGNDAILEKERRGKKGNAQHNRQTENMDLVLVEVSGRWARNKDPLVIKQRLWLWLSVSSRHDAGSSECNEDHDTHD
jgi:hypothetical protein